MKVTTTLSLKVIACEVFKRLNCLRRWTSVTSDPRFNELAKQALNVIITYMLATYVEYSGMTIHWERFPKVALWRTFQKAYVFFDIPEYITRHLIGQCQLNNDAFDKASMQIISELISDDFRDYLLDGTGTLEQRIYQAATKVATLVELHEIPLSQKTEEYTDKLMEIQQSILEFKDIPGLLEFADIHGEYFKLFSKISKLRNQNRWAVQPYLMDCNVLGHNFDVAILAYLIGMEQYGDNEKCATHLFFLGAFHDLAEVWTLDIPSPIKNRIPGFRRATEDFEAEMLQKHFFGKIPTFMQKKLHEVMYEEESNTSYYKLMKGADYLSGDLECWRQFVSGSRERYFYTAICRTHKYLANGKIELPPTCTELHQYLMKYAEQCILPLL